MRHTIVLLSAGMIALAGGSASAQNATPRNLILFVPDGLRGRIVTPQTAPAMAEVRDKGVNFKNSHSLMPLVFKVSGVWGNHEGSMMLWLLIRGVRRRQRRTAAHDQPRQPDRCRKCPAAGRCRSSR